jgi:hypothetical protein
MPFDPLDGIEDRPTRTQVAMIVVELRNIRNVLGAIQKTQTWVLRSFVGLLGTLAGGLALYLLTSGRHP